jgi:hypothetical protein
MVRFLPRPHLGHSGIGIAVGPDAEVPVTCGITDPGGNVAPQPLGAIEAVRHFALFGLIDDAYQLLRPGPTRSVRD